MRHISCLINSSNTRTLTESRLAEDSFLTAEDNTSHSNSTSTSLKKQDSVESNDVRYKKRNSKSLPVRNDGTLDYDGILIFFLKYE